jgi:hypothetical protein
VRHWRSGDRLQPLPHVDLFHEPRQKVLVRHREFGRSRTRNRLFCAGDPVQCHQASFTPATSCMYAPFPPSRFETFLMLMANGKLELGSSWIRLSKLVSGWDTHISTCGRTLSLGSRDKNLGPRATRMSQTTTSQCGGSSKPFSMFKHTILIIPRHPVILDSFAALIQQLDRSE